MPIRTQNGRVLLKNGRVSCECCDEDIPLTEVNFGDVGECDCETVECYNSENPSPPFVSAGGFSYENATPNSDRFTFDAIPITGPIYDQNLNVVGWVNRVSEPSVMQLQGGVGGDIAIIQLLAPGSALTWNGITIPTNILSDFNSTYRLDGAIPLEGEFPCGVCDTPRNGPHNINYVFVMIPNTLFQIRPVSFLECFPWYRLTLRKISAFTPP